MRCGEPYVPTYFRSKHADLNIKHSDDGNMLSEDLAKD